MSLLAPLYALGALAIGLPILFHLIRRTPRGRTTFSSLMFLVPSPPRITRRSRLEHWLLLLLRAAAVLLLAIAFARPFFRETAQLGFLHKHDRRIALLVDVSASMQRDNLWSQLMQQAHGILSDVSPGDDVALFTFDHQLHAIVDFESDSTTDVKARVEAIRKQLQSLKPEWGVGNIGHALADLSDQMDAHADRNQSDAVLQIHLLSDLQEGARFEALQNYQWPPSVFVDVHVLRIDKGNAGLQEIADLDDSRSGTWRVRLSNDQLAKQETFTLNWLDDSGQPFNSAALKDIYVAAGQDRVLRLDPPEGRKITGLQLDDPFTFDNRLYLSAPAPRTLSVVYVGNDNADDVRGMRYFLQQALLADPRRKVAYSAVAPANLSDESFENADLLVLTESVPAVVLEAIKQFANDGGWVVAASKNAEQLGALGPLLDIPELEVREAAVKGYVMLGEIDFQHPLFARLSEARYSDFTKIRFWKMRELVLPESTDIQVLASFENQLPAIVERLIGKGGIWLMSSTWSPDDSQLALSTKFVPLVAGWMQAADPLPEVMTRHFVGSTLGPVTSINSTGPISLQSPDRNEIAVSFDELKAHRLLNPGHYVLRQGTIQQDVAVNIDPSESRTTPVDASVLEQFGVHVGKVARPEQDLRRQRQLRDQELEKRQQVWRWLLAVVLAILAAETWIAGRTARRLAAQDARTVATT